MWTTHLNPKERKKTKPGVEDEDEGEIAVAVGVVAGEEVEEFRDILTKHRPTELSVYRIALVLLLLIRCTNAAMVSELHALWRHDQKVPRETKAQLCGVAIFMGA